VIRVYHRICQYTILERGVDLSPDKKYFVATRILTTRVLATNVHETSLQLRLCIRESFASRDPRHRGLSMSNSEARTLSTTKFFESLNALVTSLQPRETFHQSNDLAALLQQFTFRSLMIFHVFFIVFRLRRTLLRSICSFIHVATPWHI